MEGWPKKDNRRSNCYTLSKPSSCLEKLCHRYYINGIKDDNRIENLQALSWGEHSRIHKIGFKHTDEAKKKMQKAKRKKK